MAEQDLVKAIGSLTAKSEVSGPSAVGARPGAAGASAPTPSTLSKTDKVMFSEEALEDLQSVQGAGDVSHFRALNPMGQGSRVQPGMQVGGVLTSQGGFTGPNPPGMQVGGVYTSRDV